MRRRRDTERRVCIHRKGAPDSHIRGQAPDAEKDVDGIGRILEGKEMKDMEHDKDCMCHLCLPGAAVPPPNPPPAGDKEEPTPAPSQEGNKSRDYTRAVYQNLMAVVELLADKFPLLASHRQIQESLGLTKSVVFDICHNLIQRGWVEDKGNGMVRIVEKGGNITQ